MTSQMSAPDLRVLAIAMRALKSNALPSVEELVELLQWSADEILRLVHDGQWRPIDTAPKDEYVLLAFDQLPYPVVGNHECWSYKGGGWKATHWKPLPKLPRVEALDELVAQSEDLGLYEL
ncbi:MAG TPA: hypothetical protein VKO87_02985 [Gemmatimonadaceae bacterium]|nr:hypothetical protein [Gemmatimonadaceae bacterium]